MSNETYEGYDRVSAIVGEYTGFGKCHECGRNRSLIDEEVLERKCEIGTLTHESIEFYLKGLDYPLDSRCKGYFESFKKWYGQEHIKSAEIIHQEKRLFHEDLKITGQMDLILGGTITDFKTSYSASPLSWSLQAAMYYLLCEANHIKVEKIVTFVNLQKNGYQAVEYHFEMTQDLLADAYAHIRVFRYGLLTKMRP